MPSSRLFQLFLVVAVVAVVPLCTTGLGFGQDSTNSGSTTEDQSPSQNEPESDAETTQATSSAKTEKANVAWPMVCLGVGIVLVLTMIIILKVNAFLALIAAAMVVSLMSPGAWSEKISRVAESFGGAVGSIGIVIALAAVIGKCMLDSGAADRIVRFFLRLMGEKHSPVALMGSGFVLAIPVFFDTVFYLLVPLARSLHTKTGIQYLKYIMAISAGGAVTHTMVPPTPGPLMMASNLGFDIGVMILVGLIIGIPTSIVGLIVADVTDRLMKTPMRPLAGETQTKPLDDSQLPSLFISLLPVVLPVLMISANTVLTTVADAEHAALVRLDDIQDWPGFRQTLTQQASAPGDNPGKRIMSGLPAETRALIEQSSPLDEQQQEKVVTALNDKILGDKQIHHGEDDEAFLGLRLSSAARSLTREDRVRMKKVVAERMNRLLLEAAYPQHIKKHQWETPRRKAANISALFGNANLALLISAIIAVGTLVRQRGLSMKETAEVVEISLMSAGLIILITAGGGAFGGMLKEAGVGDALMSLFNVGQGGGVIVLVLGYSIGSILKIAQGSGTVAMLTGTAMLAGIADPEQLGFHPVYLATAVGAGSLTGSWMNDSGFWIFAKMGGLTEVEALKSWTIMLIILGVTSFGITVLLAQVMPLV